MLFHLPKCERPYFDRPGADAHCGITLFAIPSGGKCKPNPFELRSDCGVESATVCAFDIPAYWHNVRIPSSFLEGVVSYDVCSAHRNKEVCDTLTPEDAAALALFKVWHDTWQKSWVSASRGTRGIDGYIAYMARRAHHAMREGIIDGEQFAVIMDEAVCW